MVKIGYDVEIFYAKSGWDMVAYIVPPLWCEGTKQAPIKIPNGVGFWQRDGVALELNGMPTTGYRTFSRNATIQLNAALLKDGYFLSSSSEAQLDEETFLTSPAARDIGCEPDYNAWTEKINPPPSYHSLGRNRYAGGHLHFSWPRSRSASRDEKFQMVRTLDLLLGSLVLEKEKPSCRRDHYGRSGACRLKPYGVEWRAPDNSWFLNSRIGWSRKLFNLANLAINMPFYADSLHHKNPHIVEEHICAFNESNRTIVAEINTIVKADLASAEH